MCTSSLKGILPNTEVDGKLWYGIYPSHCPMGREPTMPGHVCQHSHATKLQRLGLLGLQLGGTVSAWASPEIICLLTFGVVMFVLFILADWRAKSPLLPLRLFGSLPRLAILGVNLSQSLITTAYTYFLPLYFRLGLGKSSIESGVYFLPTALTLAVFFLCVDHLIKRTGKVFWLIICGTSALTLGAQLFNSSRPVVRR